MRYQSPVEAPRGRFASFAVRASSPYWAALLGGMLPAFLWSAANAYFLGCRDARRQAVVAGIGCAVFLLVGALRHWLFVGGVFDAWYDQGWGKNAVLLYRGWATVQLLIALGVLRYLVGRQFDIAAYRATLEQKLPWGLPLIAALGLINYFALPWVYEHVGDDFAWIWPQLLFF